MNEDQHLPPLEPAVAQAQPTISALQEEIEFLKSQIQDYQDEIIRVKEVYQNEYNLHMLARVASAAEKSKSEYMCSECGELFTNAGYKIIAVPITGVIPEPSAIVVKAEEPAVTQEPAGPSKIAEAERQPPQPAAVIVEIEQPAATQEPTGSTKAVEKEIEKPAATQEPAGSLKAMEEEIEQPAVTQELAGSPEII